MRSTRVHAVGSAIIVATAAVWLFFAARLSNDIVSIPALDPATESPPAGAVRPALSPALPEDAIRDLRLTAERAARGTLLLTNTPGKATQ